MWNCQAAFSFPDEITRERPENHMFSHVFIVGPGLRQLDNAWKKREVRECWMLYLTIFEKSEKADVLLSRGVIRFIFKSENE